MRALVVVAALDALAACAAPTVRAALPVDVVPGDTAPAWSENLPPGPRVDSLFEAVAAPFERGFGAPERAALSAAIVAVPPGTSGWPRRDSLVRVMRVRAGGRDALLRIWCNKSPSHRVALRFSTGDAALAAHLRRVVEDELFAHAWEIGPVALALREPEDGATGTMTLEIRTVRMYPMNSNEILAKLERDGPDTRVRLYGLDPRVTSGGASFGPAWVYFELPRVPGRSQLIVTLRTDTARFHIEMTDSTRRIIRESGTIAQADERSWWRPPPDAFSLLCVESPAYTTACDDVHVLLMRSNHLTRVRAPIGLVNPFDGANEPGESRQGTNTEWRMRGPLDVEYASRCLSEIASQLRWAGGFSITVRGPMAKRLSVVSSLPATPNTTAQNAMSALMWSCP